MYLPYKDFLSRNPELYSLLHTKKVIDNKRRVSYCEKYLKGKKILNIGCLNHDIANYNQQHDEILTLGKQVIGVDIIEDAKRIKGDIEI
ncbi:MAG: hypothetical protein LBU27_01350 [Candidatus Peribacteria bacterium]|jgi:L-fucose isomerase-like protein|nr:hypothetical protein [Candidatus Peribacteria bacterium]